MSLSADDVRRAEFSLARRGYDEKQVDDFLDLVLVAIEERDAALAALPSPVPPAQVVAFGPDDAPERAVDVLSLAHRTAREHVAAAEAVAEELLERARVDAAALAAAAQEDSARRLAEAQERHLEALDGLRAERQRLEQQVPELRRQLERSRSELESYLRGVLAAASDSSAEGFSGPRALPSVSA